MEPCRTDDLPALFVNDDKRPAASHRLSEEDFEYIFFIAIAVRMLLPDEGVGRGGKKIIPIFSRKRAKLDEFAFQIWLKIKRHKSEVRGQKSGGRLVAVIGLSRL